MFKPNYNIPTLNGSITNSDNIIKQFIKESNIKSSKV